MKKKINKKNLAMFVLPVLMIGLVVGLAVYFHSVKVDSSVGEPLSSTSMDLDLSAYPGETLLETIAVHNAADVPLSVNLLWVEKSNSYSLDNTGGVCGGGSVTCEKRIIIPQADLGITDLSELVSISWDAEVVNGYLPHVDVFLDNGETLTFEYAKVQTPCDNAPYPTGNLNTFDDKGIVDDSAYAWESIPGYCGLPEFDDQHKTLADWKIFYPTAQIVKIEVEIDNWISESNSNVKNIEVNGVQVAEGVLYTMDVTNQVVQPGDNTLDISVTYETNSPVGEVSGVIELSRA